MFDVFSKRQRRKAAESSEVYKYDELPEVLRVQIVHIWMEVAQTFPEVSMRGGDVFFRSVDKALCEEFGVFRLTQNARSAEDDVFDFFLQERDVEKCLDVIEI